MKSIVSLVVLAAVLTGCASAPGEHEVTVLKDGPAPTGCTQLGAVNSTPPYILPGDDLRQMKAQVRDLEGDTVWVTHRGIIGRGVAFRCVKS